MNCLSNTFLSVESDENETAHVHIFNIKSVVATIKRCEEAWGQFHHHFMSSFCTSRIILNLWANGLVKMTPPGINFTIILQAAFGPVDLQWTYWHMAQSVQPESWAKLQVLFTSWVGGSFVGETDYNKLSAPAHLRYEANGLVKLTPEERLEEWKEKKKTIVHRFALRRRRRWKGDDDDDNDEEEKIDYKERKFFREKILRRKWGKKAENCKSKAKNCIPGKTDRE